MTCVVGIVTDKGVILGADSLGSSRNHTVNRQDSKIFTKGKFIFGCTGSYRLIQLLKFKFSIPDNLKNNDAETYMNTTFIDAVRECLRSNNFEEKSNEVTNIPKNSSFLVGYGKNLFHIQSDYQVAIARHGYAACGSGTYEALGAMFATQKLSAALFSSKDSGTNKSLHRLAIALEAAEEFDGYVRGPFKFASTLEGVECKTCKKPQATHPVRWSTYDKDNCVS